MDLLLLCPIGPRGRDVVRRKLNTEPPLAIDDHAMKVIVLINLTAQELRPERTLGGEIGCIKHGDLPGDLHSFDPFMSCARHATSNPGRTAAALIESFGSGLRDVSFP
jgi:hypothetical protein